jgi:hypothetical protein
MMTLGETLKYMEKLNEKEFTELHKRFESSFKEIFDNKEFGQISKTLLSQPSIILTLETDPIGAIVDTYTVSFKLGFLLGTLMKFNEKETLEILSRIEANLRDNKKWPNK